jgi:GntR family carbon starvation induced transcriptional regulator
MASVSQSMGISLVETIRDDILTARLKPRMKLTVKVLSALYDCGTSPLREALNRLTSEGLVERIDRRGFFVAGISADEFTDILFNRCFMEGEALRLSIEQGDGAWEERVLIAHFRLASLKREAQGPDGARPNPDWEAAHRRFHMALVSACPSQILMETCEKLHELNNRYRFFARTVQGPARSVEDEHQRLCDLALARASDGAVQALIDHYRQTGEAILKSAVASAEIGLGPRVNPLGNGALSP